MLKKIPLKNIFIVLTAMLVVPVMAFAMATTVNPSDDAEEKYPGIKITSDETDVEGATNASPLVTSDGDVGTDGVTSATGDPQNQSGQADPDGVSSATGPSGENDDDYNNDSEDDDDEDKDDEAIKDDDDDHEDDEDDEEDDDEEDDD